jgi:hypothetical protein
MATSVYETKELVLMDGTKIKMRPLKISLLRKFMSAFAALEKIAPEDQDKSMDILIDCVVIAMQQYNPELAKDKEALEDVLDLPSVYQIVEAAAGIKFDDQGNMQAVGIPG